MRLEKYKPGSLERVVLYDELRSFTIHTSSGAFSVDEREDGSLNIHESTHMRLAVHPRQANAIVLEAVDPL